jgi:hypothetical protein
MPRIDIGDLMLEGRLGESDEKSSIPAVYAGQRLGVTSFAASKR